MDRLRHRLPFALGLALACACGEEPGELDPATVAALSITSGNAQGFERTGAYLATLSPVDCDGCSGLLELAAYSVCPITGNAERTVTLSVLQTGGVLLLGYENAAATGPIDADGAFAVGSVADISSPLTEGHVLLRIDGAFEPDAEPHAFDGLLRQRMLGRADGTEIDCTESLEISAYRLP